MKAFAQLFKDLDETNKTLEKVNILKKYFHTAADDDKMYTLALFAGRRPKRQINATRIKMLAIEMAEIPQWLFEESYQVVGDLSETITLLLPPSPSTQSKSLREVIEEINGLAKKGDLEKKEWVKSMWLSMDNDERFVFNKLLLGSFRIGVSQNLIVKAIGALSGLETAVLMHRLMGDWRPETFSFSQLVSGSDEKENPSRPYPFFLAYPIEEKPDTLGAWDEWQAEWKWDGIRAQIIRRQGQSFIWSRGEDLISNKFPELLSFAEKLPDGTALDGELLCYKDGKPQPFSVLQTRIGRKTLSAKFLAESPAAFMAYDCMEFNTGDLRNEPLADRRAILAALQRQIADPRFYISPVIAFSDWRDLEIIRNDARKMLAEGIMLKKKSSVYEVGRKKGAWWKWKIDPLAVDAVMIYAQKGHGRRADLYTDYTFAVWKDGALVPFAKAYSGLTDKEITEVDQFIKKNTLEKFGPVRTVKPELVFEIGFEGINRSTRHKSGIAVRFPRMLRWRKDKNIAEADTIESLQELLLHHG